MGKQYFLLMSILLLLSIDGFAQTSEVGPSTFSDLQWNTKVKQIDDFINRFNNSISYQQNKQALTFQLRPEDYRLLLENLIEISKNELTENFVAAVMEFNQSDKLSFLDSGWYAEAQIQVGFQGKDFLIPMILALKKDQKIGYKWTIESIRVPEIEIWKVKSNQDKFINPANHSLRFSNFEYLFDGEGDFGNLLSDDLIVDQASLILFLAASGKFDFVKTLRIRYHFLQFPDYLFIVENYDRQATKSGWLISTISHADEFLKIKYLNNLLTGKNDEK